MSSYFRKKKIDVNIVCKLYEVLPAFRMTFIGENRLLIASYEKVKRTGDHTTFFDISSDGSASILQGFVNGYYEISPSAKQIFSL